MIKLQKKKIFINKTYSYLLPLLRYYGDDFVDCFNNYLVNKLAVGVNDESLVNIDVNYDNHLFILLDCNIGRKAAHKYEEAMHYFIEHEAYEVAYEYDDYPDAQMLVLKLPSIFPSCVNMFLLGLYSCIVPKEELQNYYRVDSVAYKNMTKDKELTANFMQQLKIKFDYEQEGEWRGELDFPPNPAHEIFRHRNLNLREHYPLNLLSYQETEE